MYFQIIEQFSGGIVIITIIPPIAVTKEFWIPQPHLTEELLMTELRLHLLLLIDHQYNAILY